jgi:hypothetical protein
MESQDEWFRRTVMCEHSCGRLTLHLQRLICSSADASNRMRAPIPCDIPCEGYAKGKRAALLLLFAMMIGSSCSLDPNKKLTT